MNKRTITIPDRVYFRIGEVATLLGVEPHVVRFWQAQFAAVRLERSAAGRFLYPRKAVAKLVRIRELLYDEGYTIAGARNALQLEAKGAGQRPAAAATAGSEATSAPQQDSRKTAELTAEVERLQREVRALEARLEAARRTESDWHERQGNGTARLQADLLAALADAEALLDVVNQTAGAASVP